MLSKRIITAMATLLFANSVLASQPLGTPLVLQLGTESTLATGGIMMIAAVSLAVGIRMVKQKQQR
ncbi:hypothetical protein EYC98_18485 [Halieaceae bacterium IMCC14734]|uniref:LPXTG cell wall anchor domain-containing protein n=2 Tax=Candidatus Litorirhabdus singularis TaxID=2518993 RepID=A0ABT3TKM2_9GAMM|nr:hypothetical protein [Candidatus Litorirhabdus singularis]